MAILVLNEYLVVVDEVGSECSLQKPIYLIGKHHIPGDLDILRIILVIREEHQLGDRLEILERIVYVASQLRSQLDAHSLILLVSVFCSERPLGYNYGIQSERSKGGGVPLALRLVINTDTKGNITWREKL